MTDFAALLFYFVGMVVLVGYALVWLFGFLMIADSDGLTAAMPMALAVAFTLALMLGLFSLKAKADRHRDAFCALAIESAQSASDSLAVYTEFDECRIERP